jgi:hypothetical protein
MAEVAIGENQSRLDRCKQANINKMTVEVADPNNSRDKISIKVQKLINTKFNSYGNASIDLTDDKLLALTEALSEGELTLKFDGEELAKIKVTPGDPPLAVVKIGDDSYQSFVDDRSDTLPMPGQLLADVVYRFGRESNLAESSALRNATSEEATSPEEADYQESSKTYKKFRALYQESLSNIGHAKTSFWGFFESLFSSVPQLNTTRYNKPSYQLDSDEQRANQFENLMDAVGLVRSVIQSKELKGVSVSYKAFKFEKAGNKTPEELCLKITFMDRNKLRSIYIRPNAERRGDGALMHFNCRIFGLDEEGKVIVPAELKSTPLRPSRDFSLALSRVLGVETLAQKRININPQQTKSLNFSQCAQAIERAVASTGARGLEWSEGTLKRENKTEGRGIKIKHGGKTYVIGADSDGNLSIYEQKEGKLVTLNNYSNFAVGALETKLKALLPKRKAHHSDAKGPTNMLAAFDIIEALRVRYQGAGIAVKVIEKNNSRGSYRGIELTRKIGDKQQVVTIWPDEKDSKQPSGRIKCRIMVGSEQVKPQPNSKLIDVLGDLLISPAERNRSANLSDALREVSGIEDIQVSKIERLFPGSSAYEACLKIKLREGEDGTIIFRPSVKREYNKHGVPTVFGRYYFQDRSGSDWKNIILTKPRALKEAIAAILNSSDSQ